MAYKALYRTYRPQKFSEVIGQEHIVRTLQNSITNNKISHAYLFSGPRGTGKTSIARIFAKALNCSSPINMEPCSMCDSCLEIAQGISPDVIEIDAASNNGVDEIREIRDKVKFLPGGNKYKIYIIDEVHMLSQGAFNALLKTLEEPPKHVIFILATTEPHKILPTILSRCQRYDFKTLSVQEIASVVKSVSLKEGFKISDEAIIGIAEGAEGGMRDALSYLDQAASFANEEITIDDVNNVTGNLNYDKIIELAKYFEEKNVNKALKTVNDLVIMGKEINKIVSSMLQFYRDCLLFKNIDVSKFSKYIFEKEEFKNLASTISEEKIFYYVDLLSDVQTKIKTAIVPNIYLEVVVIKMINSSESEMKLINRIKALEERLENNPPIVSEGGVVVENEKVLLLESRLQKVVSELSKLELHKLSDRVANLELNSNHSTDNYLDEIIKLRNDFDLFKNNNSVATKDVDLSSVNEELTYLKNRINNIDNYLKQLPNKKDDVSEVATPDIENKIKFINSTITNLQEEIFLLKNKKDSSNLSNEYLEKLSHIETKMGEINVDSDLNYELDLIKDKLNNLETRVYKLTSGVLLTESINKKTKPKVNRNQIVLFGDEVIGLSEFKKFERTEVVETKKVTEVVNKQENDTETINEVVEDNPQEIIESECQEEIKPMNEIISTIKTDGEEIIEREHSQLVRRIASEPKTDQQEDKNEQTSLTLDSSLNKEDLIIENKEVVRVQEEKPQLVKVPIEVDDEFSRYDVNVLERILHDSRTEEARSDRARITNLWKSLDNSVDRHQLHIANLLQDGKLVAVGIKEFVITYPNSALCNQVMRYGFKKESLKLLYDFLGDTYNYFAIPESIWNEKRTEYINQYNIGIRFPKLTPINEPTLNVLDDNKKYYESEESSLDKAISFFSKELVKIE